jgi:oligoribonuclease
MKGRLVWIDLEMTGLDVRRHTIVEIAVLITGSDLAVRPGEYAAAIKTSETALRRSSRAARTMHRRSGLMDRIRSSSTTMRQAERGALALIRRHCRKGEGLLAGNSIATDRRFLRRYMPRLEAYLHYRMIDVTTIKELARRWFPARKPFRKKGAHTAMSDIRESIAELEHYRRTIFRKS